jgi:hypothetical protein
MSLGHIAILTAVAAGTWWLTGLDKTAAGESKRDHYLTRALRCGAVVFLSWIFLWILESPANPGQIPLLIIVPMSMAIVLRSALSEVFTHGFMRWLDPELHDKRKFDPKRERRYQDAIAHLIHAGRRAEAIKLCEELKESGEVDAVTLANTLEYLGVKQEERKRVSPLAEIARLRRGQKFGEAETRLRGMLKQNPADHGAAIMLMRLYAQDLRQPERAYRVLSTFEKHPHADAARVEFARRSIPDWSAAREGAAEIPEALAAPATDQVAGHERQIPGNAEISQPPATPETERLADPAALEKLLAARSLGAAVELLEREIKQRPTDWHLQFKLAEVYAVHCHDLGRAENIVLRCEHQPGLPADQAELARVKLAEWRAIVH